MFLFFAWIPPGHRLLLRRLLLHSFTYARTHAYTHLLTHFLRQAGAVQRASWLPFGWQAQYTEPPQAADPRLPFAWQAQYTEPPGGAAAAGPRLPFAW